MYPYNMVTKSDNHQNRYTDRQTHTHTHTCTNTYLSIFKKNNININTQKKGFRSQPKYHVNTQIYPMLHLYVLCLHNVCCC